GRPGGDRCGAQPGQPIARGPGVRSSREGHRRCVRGRRRRRDRAAVPARREGRRGQCRLPDRALPRHLGGLRDGTGHRGHRHLLVRLRPGRHPGAHPGRWPGHHDAGQPAGAVAVPAAGPAGPPHRADGDQGAQRDRRAARDRHRRALQPGRGGRGRHRADRPVRRRLRRLGAVGDLRRGLPRRLGVQQRRLLALRRQPDRVRRRSMDQPAHHRRGHRRRPGLPGRVRAGPGVADAGELVGADPYHGHRHRSPARRRDRGDAGRRERQPRHARAPGPRRAVAGGVRRRCHAAHRGVQQPRRVRLPAGDAAAQRRPDVHRRRQCRHRRRHQGDHLRPAGLRAVGRDARRSGRRRRPPPGAGRQPAAGAGRRAARHGRDRGVHVPHGGAHPLHLRPGPVRGDLRLLHGRAVHRHHRRPPTGRAGAARAAHVRRADRPAHPGVGARAARPRPPPPAPRGEDHRWL
ncbi:MAG: KtrAB potassium uptake system, integral membrane component KtrB, partial [uncultured Blastococcus sp.]